MQANKDGPESFYCPISQELMTDPVCDPEGNSYERRSIEKWLEKNNTSPITRSPLKREDLVPNRALRDAIEERLKQSKEGAAPGPAPAPGSPPVRAQAQAPVAAPAGAAAAGAAASVSVSARQAKEGNNNYDVLVTVAPPDGNNRVPCDICCVVDISGSMGTEATLKNESGQKEGHGLSLLDIVKHAVKTIVATLQPSDRLALVTYSNTAKVVLGLTPMNDAAKARVAKEMDDLQPDDSTNLWDGLHTGLELLRKESGPGHLTALLLLTDGLPNISPPRGEIPMLQRYKDQNQQLACTISTFGFGYSINSELLREIAVEGSGMYSFIPDSSFVGTAFVHAVSNLLVTVAREVRLSLEPLNGAKILNDGVLGGHPVQTASWGVAVNVGSLQLGQTKDMVVRMSLPAGAAPYLNVTAKFELNNSQKTEELTLEAARRDGTPEVDVQRFRLLLVDRTRQAMEHVKKENLESAKGAIARLVAEIEQSEAKDDPRVKGLLADLTGQVTEALSKKEYFKKWGAHYLPSLMRAHLLQQANNFKDPGLQFFGGALFRKLRDDADDAFLKLPPPKPSIKKTTSSSSSSSSSGGGGGKSGSAAAAPPKPVNMRQYHNRSNPCFAAGCSVLLADGSRKNVEALAKGDAVMAPSGRPAVVRCVVRTACHEGRAELVELAGGLLVTPYHPVRVGGKWAFPRDLGRVEERPCPAVFSFVLQEEHVMLINGVECVALGHGFRGAEVIEHPYFGSERVLADLQRLPGWDSGLVQLQAGCLVRDPLTKLVCGLALHPEDLVDGTRA